jgi:hypothetical protein
MSNSLFVPGPFDFISLYEFTIWYFDELILSGIKLVYIWYYYYYYYRSLNTCVFDFARIGDDSRLKKK